MAYLVSLVAKTLVWWKWPAELAKRWMPILDIFEEMVWTFVMKFIPIHDGVTFERFYEATNKHNRVKIMNESFCTAAIGLYFLYRSLSRVYQGSHVKDPNSTYWQERGIRRQKIGNTEQVDIVHQVTTNRF